MEPFLISTRMHNDEYCFKPLIVKNKLKTIVSWCYNSGENIYLMMKVYNENTNPEITICSLEEEDEPFYLECIGDDKYKFCIETKNGYNFIYINEIGEILSTEEYITEEMPVNPQYFDSKDYFNYNFTFDYKSETCKISQNGSIVHTYTKVSGMPVIIYINNGYLVSYLNRNNEQIVNYFSINTNENFSLPREELVVEYLVGCQIDSKTCVIGGYSIKEKTLKLNYYRVENDTIKKIDSYFWRSNDNSTITISVSPINKGFILISESPNMPIKIQRFTHLGTWLYSSRSFDQSLDAWSAIMANDFICYLKDGELWGCIVKIADIPEIEHLTL